MDDDLLAATKQLAAQTGRTLTAVIEDALREALMRQRQKKRPKPIRLPTMAGNGLQPGVDLDDSAALLELMEREG
jgi:hypothetical protein